MGQLNQVLYGLGLEDWVEKSLAAAGVELSRCKPPLPHIPMYVAREALHAWSVIAKLHASNHGGKFPHAVFLAVSATDVVPTEYKKYFTSEFTGRAYDVEMLVSLSHSKETLEFVSELLTPHPPMTLAQFKEATGLD